MILIIAYGNELREDDGAGLLLAERLASAWQARGVAVQSEIVQQLAPELAADIAGEGVAAVVFVDARMSTSPSDEGVAVVPLEPAADLSPSMAHHLQPGALLAYTQALCAAGALPPAWLVTVPGIRFGYGQAVSGFVKKAIQAAFDSTDHPLPMLIESLSSL